MALIAVLASLLSVSLIKRYSLTSCPWELEVFGGVARYIPHWQWGVHDGGGGRCFPGGHASSALGLMPASLPFLVHSQPSLRKTGRRIFLLTSGTGLLFGLVQTLRGAHYPSHTLWTAVICWATGAGVYLALQRRRIVLVQ
jgi:membrane-associated PAP2 superfamily phosphatase